MPDDSSFPHVFLIDAESIGLAGIEVPESTSFDFQLVDHDAQECRIVSPDELAESYVDTNIVSIGGLFPELWSLDPGSLDSQQLKIEYSDGRILSMPLGRISMEHGHHTMTYMKKDGFSYAVDNNQNILLDLTNTPRLAVTRIDFHEQLAQRSEDRLELSTVTAIFGSILSANANLNMTGIFEAQEAAKNL